MQRQTDLMVRRALHLAPRVTPSVEGAELGEERNPASARRIRRRWGIPVHWRLGQETQKFQASQASQGDPTSKTKRGPRGQTSGES